MRHQRGRLAVSLWPVVVAATLTWVASARADGIAEPPVNVTITAGSEANERVTKLDIAKTNAKSEQVIYSVRLPALAARERVRVRGEVELTKCTVNDPCGGNSYGYAPMIKARLVLARTRSDTAGFKVLDEDGYACTTAKHHCPIRLRGEQAVSPAQAGEVYVNLVAGAAFPNAGPKDTIDLKDGTAKKGGQLAAIRLASSHSGKPDGTPSTNDEVDRTIPIQTKAPNADPVPVVIYSVPVGDLKRGEVLDVSAEMQAKMDDRIPNSTAPPLMASRIVLVKQAGNVEANAAQGERWIAGNIGRNCRPTCEVRRDAAIRIDQDLTGMHVNFVALASRTTPAAEAACPPKSCKAKVPKKGGSLKVERFKPTAPASPVGVAPTAGRPQPPPPTAPQGPPPAPPRAPAVVTDDATGVDCRSATLRGTVRPHGLATTYWFEYWRDGNFDSRQVVYGSAGSTGPIPIAHPVSGLQPNKRYRFRIGASNSAGQQMADMRQFDTKQNC